MSRKEPGADCHDLSFRTPLEIGDAAAMALEDYAREVSRGRTAEVLRDPADPPAVEGVHLCGVAGPPTAVEASDIEDFARTLVAANQGGLGWS